MRAELPYLGAGALAITGGAIRNGGWPSNAIQAIVATIALVILASMADNTKVAPLVRAVGILLFLSAAMGAITAATKRKKKK